MYVKILITFLFVYTCVVFVVLYFCCCCVTFHSCCAILVCIDLDVAPPLRLLRFFRSKKFFISFCFAIIMFLIMTL